MKPVDVKDIPCIDLDKQINNKDPKFKVSDHVKISKYKNIFFLNFFEEVFVIKKVKKYCSMDICY